MEPNKNKSISRTAATILPVRTTLGFAELCRARSAIYRTAHDPRLSAARFLREAAAEKLAALGVDEKLIEKLRG